MAISEIANEELQLIESMYPSQFTWLQEPDQDSDSCPSFRLTIETPFRDGLERTLKLTIALPRSYPSGSYASLTLTSDAISREDEQRLNGQFRAWLASPRNGLPPVGEVCIDVLVTKALELVQAFTPTRASTQTGGRGEAEKAPSGQVEPENLAMAWTVFWMHHIKATGKRKNIVAWARELGLRGWAKPGYPGALVVDGPLAAVEEYSARLKALRWKAIQQRLFEHYAVPFTAEPLPTQVERARKIKANNAQATDEGVVEVATMADLLACVRTAGLESAVLESLKIK